METGIYMEAFGQTVLANNGYPARAVVTQHLLLFVSIQLPFFIPTLSDHSYEFLRGNCNGVLAFSSGSWSSSLSHFGETFVVASDISKAFDKVWHKPLLTKLTNGFHPSFCSLHKVFFQTDPYSLR